jgi:hypothetical protein
MTQRITFQSITKPFYLNLLTFATSFQILALSALVAVAVARPQAPSSSYAPAPAPTYGPAPIVEVYPDTAPQYNFEYAVADSYNNNFGHVEGRDGYKTSGSYMVNLPDSRTQIVTYTVDENGYVADVKYEGEAVFPPAEVKPSYAPAKPAYAPAA